jgi:hypothetical protein
VIEEDTKVEPREIAPAEQYGEALFYDLGKFVTTLALLAIGGVLTIADSERIHVQPVGIAIIAGVLALAATVAGIIPLSIAQARFANKPLTANLPRYLAAAMALLGFGVGMFLYVFVVKLN